MRIRGLYINDKVKHILAFSLISLCLSWFLGPLWGVMVCIVFSVSKGLRDWKQDVVHSRRFFRIRKLNIPSEFLLDQGSDIIGIVAGTLLSMGIFHSPFFP